MAGLMASKVAKIGAGVAAGGSTMAIVVSLIGAQISDVNAKIDDKDRAIRQYVDFRHEAVMGEISHVNKGQDEIKDILKKIEQRMYESRTTKER